MFSRLLVVFFVLGLGRQAALAAPASAGAPMQLVLSDAISLRFMVPPGWFAQGKPMMAGKASHIEMFSMTGKHKLKLTVLVPQGETAPFEAQTKMVEADLAKQLERSVEDKVTLVTAKTDGAQFVYGTLTDKALVGKPVPRGQWRHVTSGLSSHSGFVVTMSLYSQEKDDPGHAVAIAAWQAMTGASADALHEMSYPAPGDGPPLVFSAPAMHMVEIILGPPPAGMEFSDGAPPPLSVKGQREDGLSFTLETMQIGEATLTSRECLAPYMTNVLGSWGSQPGVGVKKKSIKVEDKGALVRFAFTVVGQASAADTRELSNVAYLLGRPGHCSLVHFMSDGGSPKGNTHLEQVDKTVAAGE